jgi:hypothetical protein
MVHQTNVARAGRQEIPDRKDRGKAQVLIVTTY